ncbi:MAG: UDP-glucose 4-epimerase GalE [Oscillospiraceae bacterium]|nr:UDP-glucose 4-epimerase GalE [Oscillospiraceae bacterium]
MAILVTGGAGYIGSHTVVELLAGGYDVIIADNFYNSSPKVLDRLKTITGVDVPFVECDVCDKVQVEELFASHPEIDAVIHFAAYKAVGESVEKPLDYYENNIGGAMTILQAMKRHNVKNFVFSSSATVYGDPETVPCTEESPANGATNPYGWTKVMQEQILRDLCHSDKDMNVAILRYFNPIGAHPSGLIGEDPNGIPNNLLPYIAQAAIGKYPSVRVFGTDYPTPDGTGVRDYIHVVDLAKGHVAAVKKLFTKSGLVTYNLGTGNGYSVLQVIKAYEKAIGRELEKNYLPRRAGDIAENYADPRKAKEELGWEAEYTIDDMCAHSWNWQSNNPNGYKE